MSLQALNDAEKQVVFDCLRAAVNGPFFPNWEFRTVFGLHRHEVAQVVAAISDIDDSDELVSLAIHNTMGNLLGYPHAQAAAWRQFISVPEDEVGRIFDKWKFESPGD